MNKTDLRLQRIFDRIKKRIPWTEKAVNWISQPDRHWIRLPVAVLFLLGSLLSFLPGLGIWMLPVGLLLLSIDLPQARGFTVAFVINSERFIKTAWRKLRDYFIDRFSK